MSCIDFNSVSENDLDTILAIEEECFPKPWSYLSFLNELRCEHAFLFAARHTGIKGSEQIIGYICFRIIAGEMHILKIAVENSWQRHGIATSLLNNYITDVSKSNIHAAFLEVRRSNNAAISFYNKLGFMCVGTRPNYYSNSNSKEDALLMMKVLKEAK